MIYFIQPDVENTPWIKLADDPPIKIGLTEDFSSRFYVYRTECPWKNKVLLLIKGERDKEEKIHKNFKHLRLTIEGILTEWFSPEKDLLYFIECQQKFKILIERYEEKRANSFQSKINQRADSNNILIKTRKPCILTSGNQTHLFSKEDKKKLLKEREFFLKENLLSDNPLSILEISVLWRVTKVRVHQIIGTFLRKVTIHDYLNLKSACGITSKKKYWEKIKNKKREKKEKNIWTDRRKWRAISIGYRELEKNPFNLLK